MAKLQYLRALEGWDHFSFAIASPLPSSELVFCDFNFHQNLFDSNPSSATYYFKILEKLFDLPVPQFPSVQNQVDNSTYLIGLLSG